MNKLGITILCCFAPLWIVFAKLNDAPIPWLGIASGVGVSVGLIWLNHQQKRVPAVFSQADQKRIGRVFMWATIAEGVGIPLVIIALASVGVTDRNMAVFALVVGLHFIPIGVKVPMRMALILAAFLLALSILGFLVPSPQTAALVVGCAGAIISWVAAGIEIFMSNQRIAAK